jgi:hypothetical protein
MLLDALGYAASGWKRSWHLTEMSSWKCNAEYVSGFDNESWSTSSGAYLPAYPCGFTDWIRKRPYDTLSLDIGQNMCDGVARIPAAHLQLLKQEGLAYDAYLRCNPYFTATANLSTMFELNVVPFYPTSDTVTVSPPALVEMSGIAKVLFLPNVGADQMNPTP